MFGAGSTPSRAIGAPGSFAVDNAGGARKWLRLVPTPCAVSGWAAPPLASFSRQQLSVAAPALITAQQSCRTSAVDCPPPHANHGDVTKATKTAMSPMADARRDMHPSWAPARTFVNLGCAAVQHPLTVQSSW